MNPRAMVQTMIALASASLGLVAALAWNEAIKLRLIRCGAEQSYRNSQRQAPFALVNQA